MDLKTYRKDRFFPFCRYVYVMVTQNIDLSCVLHLRDRRYVVYMSLAREAARL